MHNTIKKYTIPGCEIQGYTMTDSNQDGIKEKTYTTIQSVKYFGPRDLSMKEKDHFASIADVTQEIRKVYLVGVNTITKKEILLINGERYQVLKVYPVSHPKSGVVHHHKVYVTQRKT